MAHPWLKGTAFHLSEPLGFKSAPRLQSTVRLSDGEHSIVLITKLTRPPYSLRLLQMITGKLNRAWKMCLMQFTMVDLSKRNPRNRFFCQPTRWAPPMTQAAQVTTRTDRDFLTAHKAVFLESVWDCEKCPEQEAEYLDSVLFRFKFTISLTCDMREFKGKEPVIFLSTHKSGNSIQIQVYRYKYVQLISMSVRNLLLFSPCRIDTKGSER